MLGPASSTASAIWSETAVRASWASVSGVIENLLLEGHVTWAVKVPHPPNGEVPARPVVERGMLC
jgi:hypothetical protein